MVFSSALFLFLFLPITLLGYFLLRKTGARNVFLLIASLIFFAWSQPGYLWIILTGIAVNYAGAMLVSRARGRLRTFFLIAAVTVNLALLFYFKYFSFLIDSLDKAFGTSWAIPDIVLPVGISFFTFQGMSYTIDVWRGSVRVQKNPLKVALYIVLFPQLIAGPIVRYRDIEKEIDARHVSVTDFAGGIRRFIIGLAKKSVIANTAGLMIDNIWKAGVAENTPAIAWAGSIAYMLQIYYDFSGYSDMAIGLGRMFGFHFPENFNLPYVSKSISEFWRRWHISLGTWFRDYVYIPLGGNRRHVYRNLAVVFLLTGIWHGAAWHYIAWGVYHGFFILAERYLRRHRRPAASAGNSGAAAGITASSRGKRGASRPVPSGNAFFSALGHIYTLFAVNIGWVIFRAPNTMQALAYIRTMFGAGLGSTPGYSVFWYLDRFTLAVMIAGIFFASSLPSRIGKALRARLPENAFLTLEAASLLGLLAFSMLRIVSGTYNPFIYFQF